jgi:hypothetical protein
MGQITKVERTITERNVVLGIDLIGLRNAAGSNREFSRMVRRAFDIDPMTATLYARVARAYGDRRDITSRVNWPTLVALSMLPASIQRQLERRILAGERVGANDIRRAWPRSNTTPQTAAQRR